MVGSSLLLALDLRVHPPLMHTSMGNSLLEGVAYLLFVCDLSSDQKHI